MKSLIIIAVVLLSGIFYSINQANKKKIVLLKKQEVSCQQKLDQWSMKAIQATQYDVELKQAEHKAKIEVAEQKVKKELFDPHSAKFRNQQGNCGEVDAKNKMGEYIGFSRYVYLPIDEAVIIESNNEDAIFTPQIMDSLWSSKCG